ncbi:MAG TPA: hypothetical protein PLV59_01930 [Candidatus Dojkabacteria bacterium]|nr:hypothetical protein [Candidatus Dojkabacteria bacterium]
MKRYCEQAIAGPTTDEIELGLRPTFGDNRTIWFASASNCNNKDFNITTQSNGYVTIQFCRDTMLAGDMSGFIIEQQFESTLKEFDDVTKVRILDSKGQCFNDMRGDPDPNTCYR